MAPSPRASIHDNEERNLIGCDGVDPGARHIRSGRIVELPRGVHWLVIVQAVSQMGVTRVSMGTARAVSALVTVGGVACFV